MRYELMDLETGNVVRFYGTEAAALRDVAATVRRLGPEAIASLALGQTGHPAGGVVLEGAALVERALAAPAKNSHARATRRARLPA